MSNFDLIKWVNKLDIKHFKGIFSRDNLPNQIDEPEVGIINLDRKSGPGTHWVCYRNVDKHICEYFDSFGLIMPTEIQKKDGGVIIPQRSQPFFSTWDQMTNNMLRYGKQKKKKDKKNDNKWDKDF